MSFKIVGILLSVFLFNFITCYPGIEEKMYGSYLSESQYAVEKPIVRETRETYEHLRPTYFESQEKIENQMPFLRERRDLLEGLEEHLYQTYVESQVPSVRKRRGVLEELEEQPLYESDMVVESGRPLVRERRQLFGGRSGLTHQIGYRAGPAWGSMTHSGGPITYSGGADFNSPAGHGLSGSLSHTPGIGGQGAVRGTLGLINTPDHKLSAWAEHSRNFDSRMHISGPETNSAGLSYQHGSGANAFITGSKTPGLPSSGSVGGSIPLYSSPTSSLTLSGQTNVAEGMKPNHQVGLEFKKTF